MIVVEIDGVDVSDSVQSFEIERAVNERARATIVVEGTVPAEDDEVVIYAKDGVTPTFSGVVLDVRVNSVAPNTTDALTTVEAVDWELFFEWCSVSLDYNTSGAGDVDIEDVIDEMIAQVLGDYGFTYTPAALGVTVAPFTWDDISVAEAVRQIRERTGLVLRVTPAKAIILESVGASAAPYGFTDATMFRYSSFTVGTKSRDRANRVKMRFGPDGQLSTTQRWIGDGVETSWEVDIPAVPGGWTQGYILEDGVTARTLSGPGEGGYYEWADTVGKGTVSVGSGATPADEVELTHVYTGQYPFTVIRASGATPVKEFRDRRSDITDFGAAVEVTEQALDRLDRTSALVADFVTDEDGFAPNQTFPVNTTVRGGVVSSFLISRVTVTAIKGDWWESSCAATEGTAAAQPGFEADWRRALGGSSGGSTALVVTGGGGGGGGGTTVVLSSPFPLGGADFASIDQATAGYQRVVNSTPFYAQATATCAVRVWLWARAATGNVQARLWNLTDGVSAGELTAIAATASRPSSPDSFGVLVTIGKEYELQARSTVNGNDVYAVGILYPVGS